MLEKVRIPIERCLHLVSDSSSNIITSDGGNLWETKRKQLLE